MPRDFIDINAPIEVVSDVLSDVSNWTLTDARIVRVDVEPPGPLAQGSMIAVEYPGGPTGSVTIDMLVVEYEPMGRSVMTASIEGMRMTTVGTLEALPNGRTRYTTEVRLGVERLGGVPTYLVTRLAMVFQKRSEREILERVKELCERRHESAAAS